ncbi:MAG: hypothetical protein SPL13_01965 [Clostridia bacterium]|nr:hypothetical protein [Clostridia bacterium]
MNYPITDFFKKMVITLSPDGFFVIVAGLILCGFFAAVITAIKVKNNGVSVFFAVVSAAASTVFSAIILLAEASFIAFSFYFAALTAETVVFTLIIRVIENKKGDYEEEKNLVKYIDGEIKKESATALERVKESEFSDQTPEIKKCTPQSSDEHVKETTQIDFTHVKNVIERLSHYDVNPTEKKRIEDLKDVLLYAENRKITLSEKEKINDGLSFLLKIMSKYGV